MTEMSLRAEVRVVIAPMTEISDAAASMLALATTCGINVRADFNGRDLVATPESTLRDVVAPWYASARPA